MTNRQPIVAIDGPAGSGKSTVAQRVARAAGLQFISSGSLYRAVALCALRQGEAMARERLIDLAAALQIRFSTDADGTVRAWVDAEDVTEALRRPEVEQIAAVVATIPEVRAHLVAKLQAYGRGGGLVMEGRDIQTVVFPDAEIKVFLTASPEIRAKRRWSELRAKGTPVEFQQVLGEVNARDGKDVRREADPLRAAPDAIRIDTDTMTIDAVVARILRLIDDWRVAAGGGHP